MDVDPEFLALPERKQRAIDRAFNRGLRLCSKRPAKRRKLDSSASNSRVSTPRGPTGGFIDDGGDGGGGFIPEDGGGFIPEDGEDFIQDDDGGGFVPEGGGFEDGGGFIDEGGGLDETPRTSRPSSAPAPDSNDRIPLRLIASLLSGLGLPTDNDVLEVFRASAHGWGEEDGDDSVSRKDFQAVCAALMPDAAEEPEADGEAEGEAEEYSSDDDDEDDFEPSDDEEYDAGDDDGDYGAGPSSKNTKPAKSTKTRTTRRTRAALLEEDVPKLSGQQRELAKELWDMLKPGTGIGSHLIGVTDVKKLARDMGEMWSDDEIADMVTLFSNQHEGRGLSFEDFGVVMMRAGLV